MRKIILIALMLLPGCDRFSALRNYNKKYVTVCRCWATDLSDVVNDYLEHGYEVVGQVAVSRNGVCQTLIKGDVMRYDVQNMGSEDDRQGEILG
ncbi:MAG: hypothetical protein V4568_18190 [Pseudomonadota bacterium]